MGSVSCGRSAAPAALVALVVVSSALLSLSARCQCHAARSSPLAAAMSPPPSAVTTAAAAARGGGRVLQEGGGEGGGDGGEAGVGGDGLLPTNPGNSPATGHARKPPA
ncbi:Os07g0260150 [Oryza sativa Japonica Group]|uniref:Os07g0260150 protein n=1 Tax=Oryza sativa subsp. japonica TaxID=39947 RepID=A0A0P0X4M1_ORYSJ|nr:Os07g0260150 [Oryza sativa Japonica Group]